MEKSSTLKLRNEVIELDKTDETIKTYDKHAGSYEKKFMDFDSYKKMIKGFCDRLSIGAKILDVGCGPGNGEIWLEESGKDFDILGIDLSAEMIRRANANVNSPYVAFMVGDIRHLAIENGTYDAVVASFCLPHLSNDEAKRLIEDIGKAVRKGGLLYLSCMEGDSSGFEITSFSAGDDIYINYYSRELIREILSKYAFQIVDFQTDGYLESDGSETTDMFFVAKKC